MGNLATLLGPNLRPPQPINEPARLEVLKELKILDSAPEPLFDTLASLASEASECPISWISFVDQDREWLKASVGTQETFFNRSENLGGAAIASGELVLSRYPVTEKPIDPKFPVAFYASIPIIVRNEFAVGTVTVLHTAPHHLRDRQVETLIQLSHHISHLLELRLENLNRAEELAKREDAEQKLEDYVARLQDAHIDLQVQGEELSQENAILQTLAETDGLTGLRNQRSFYSELRERFERNDEFSLVVIDIDQFKAFNDVYGHVAGDEALQQVGRAISGSIRDHDFAYRQGGEEFALLLTGPFSKNALEVAERLRRAVEQTEWKVRQITLCAGVAHRTAEVTTMEDLIRRADAALYAAKRSGRNRVLAWSDTRQS